MKGKWPYLILLLCVVLLALVQQCAPKNVDWRPSYSQNSKMPLGSYVLFEQLNDIFPGKAIETVTETVYNVLGDSTLVNKNYIFQASNIHFSKPELIKLFNFVERGNNVFLSSNSFYSIDFATDSLQLNRQYLSDSIALDLNNYQYSYAMDSVNLILSHPQLQTDTLKKIAKRFGAGLVTTDTSNFKLLGSYATLNGEDTGKNYVSLKYGNGKFLFYTNPNMLTNYSLLDDNKRAYAEQVISHLPNNDILWDEYYKPDRNNRINPETGEEEGLFSVVWKSPALRAAFWLLVLGALFFLFFKGKREQRVIPVIEPPKNLSLEFVKTIGEVYFERGDHTNLAKKKVNFFRDFLLRKYNIKQLIDTPESRDYFIKRTGIETKVGKEILDRMFLIEHAPVISQDLLMRFSTIIEQLDK